MPTDNSAARSLKLTSSSRRIISEDPVKEAFKKSTTRVLDGALPAFFDLSDCNTVQRQVKCRVKRLN